MIDAALLFDGTYSSNNNPPTGAIITNTRTSTNVIDLSVARDVAVDAALEVHVDVLQAFTAGGAATLQIKLQSSTQTNSNFVDLLLSPVYAVGDLIVGSPIFRYGLPINQANNTNGSGTLLAPNRYLQLDYIVSTGPFTAGSVLAYLTAKSDRNEFTVYPRNYVAPKS